MENDFKEKEIFEELLQALAKEFQFKIKGDMNEQQKQIAYETFICLLGVEQINEYIKELHNKYLNLKRLRNGVVELFKTFAKSRPEDCFNCKADALVVFTDSLFSGNKSLTNINNQLVLEEGVQLNEHFYKLLKEDFGVAKYVKPYIVNATLLPVKRLIKILVPQKENLCLQEEIDFRFAVERIAAYLKENKLKEVVLYFDKDLEILKNKIFVEKLFKEINLEFKKKNIKNIAFL